MKNKALYLECASGISGDMFVGAMLDLGADASLLLNKLKSLPLEGAEPRISRIKKNAIDMCDFSVLLDEEHENHDHDMDYLHGHTHGHDHNHNHDCACEHVHIQEHDHAHECGRVQEHAHQHTHVHRNMADIIQILHSSALDANELALAEKIFGILAEAEAKAHGIPVEEVHFHEVGAVDSILDIAAAAVCFQNLRISRVYIPNIFEGCGSIQCQHGLLPIPVPAVVNISAAYDLPLHVSEIQGEFVTPTGAAIAAAIRTDDRLPLSYRILRCGMGAGKREYERPGFLRAFLIETASDGEEDEIIKLECNVDDCSGEVLGYTMNRLLEAGARDVFYVPVYMKKNRPGIQISVICDQENRPVMEQILFRETTTIGIRRQILQRTILRREFKKISTSLGNVTVKISYHTEGCTIDPEYDEVAAIAEAKNMPFQEVFRIVREECADKL